MSDVSPIFDLKSAERIARATRWVERQSQFVESPDYGSPQADTDVWIEITGSTLDGGTYYHVWKHKERLSNGGGQWQDHPDGAVSSASAPDTRAITPNGSQIATGTIVRAIVETGEDGVATYTIVAGGSSAPIGTHFEVKLSSPSGSAGDATTQCAFDYTVKDLFNTTLGTSMAPEWAARPLVGVMTAATKGVGYYNSSNTFTLAIAYESPGAAQRNCNP